ncbi:MAG: phosphatidylinositol alpha 1,6-mannosyltransferase [Pseudonocardiales bacterium]|nr:phosphatidylinositol alpha 1,6-mannosyltransferase [Pseudonocardiales bacterium]
MRVALVAETFTPAVNGVVNSVLHVADQLASRGHEPIVVAPTGSPYVSRSGHHIDVMTVPAVAVPGYRGISIARPSNDLMPLFAEMQPDVVHLASPVILGWSAVQAAVDLGMPSVAVFQTDLSAFVSRYGLGMSAPLLWSRLRRLHNAADITLAPSTASAYHLRRHGIERVAMWGRGVDREQFHPRRRDEQWHAGTGCGDLVVGYVGRLAAEKRVELLEPVDRLHGVQLVVVGDGPRRRSLERTLPAAHFTGQLTGAELGRVMASFDVLVNPGADETFCQVVQEALCAGVPVIAAASGGPLDLVRHGENGWLWAGDDPGVLAAQVAAVRDDPGELVEVRSRARASVSFRTWSRVTDQLLQHYGRVRNDRPAVARPA